MSPPGCPVRPIRDLVGVARIGNVIEPLVERREGWHGELARDSKGILGETRQAGSLHSALYPSSVLQFLSIDFIRAVALGSMARFGMIASC
jgi:hypothetical protein